MKNDFLNIFHFLFNSLSVNNNNVLFTIFKDIVNFKDSNFYYTSNNIEYKYSLLNNEIVINTLLCKFIFNEYYLTSINGNLKNVKFSFLQQQSTLYYNNKILLHNCYKNNNIIHCINDIMYIKNNILHYVFVVFNKKCKLKLQKINNSFYFIVKYDDCIVYLIYKNYIFEKAKFVIKDQYDNIIYLNYFNHMLVINLQHQNNMIELTKIKYTKIILENMQFNNYHIVINELYKFFYHYYMLAIKNDKKLIV